MRSPSTHSGVLSTGLGSPAVVLPLSSPSTSSMASVVQSTKNPSNDFQTQLLTMLNDTFCKLSTAFGETKSESKSEWPKFSGDLKKFRTWYTSIMAQISLPPWRELYDDTTNDVVTRTNNVLLNGKLYSNLILTLEGQPLQDVITKVHLRANGIQVLQELCQTYRPKNIPEVVALKTSEFWSRTFTTIDFKRFLKRSIPWICLFLLRLLCVTSCLLWVQNLNLSRTTTILIISHLPGKLLVGHHSWFYVMTIIILSTQWVHQK